MPGRKLLGLLVAVACVLLLGWTIHKLGPARVAEAALRADPLWLAVSTLPVVGRFLIWGVKWSSMLRRERPVPFGLTLRILTVGSFVNLTTPTAKVAGGVVRAALLHRRQGWRMSTAYGWCLADQITNVLGNLLMAGLLAVGTGLLVPDIEHRAAFVVPGAVGVLAVLAAAGLRGVVWKWAQRPEVGRRLASMVPARFRGRTPSDLSAGRFARIFGPLLHHGSAVGTFLRDVGWGSLAFASVVLANALVLRALGVETPLLLIAMAVVAGYFAGVIVGVWGGIGVTEAALTGLYVQLGIPGDQAAAAVLLHRAVFYLFVLSTGGVNLLQLGSSGKVAPVE